MVLEINVSLAISSQDLAERLSEILAEMADVNILEIFGPDGAKGTVAKQAEQHIIIVDDRPAAGDIFPKIDSLRNSYPQSPIFVVAADPRPEHIVEVMKAGAAEFFFSPLDPQKLKGAVEKVRAQWVRPGRSTKGSLYSFISSKGGLGSTVIAVNTAAALAMRRKGGVALMDMSLESGDISALLDVVPATTIADIRKNYHRLDFALLQGAMVKHLTGLNLLAAPKSPEDSENIRAEHVEKVFRLAKNLFESVIVDCTSMSVNDCSLEVFKASEKVFVLTDLSVPAIRNASRLMELMQKKGIAPTKIEVVVNRFIKGKVPTLDEIEESLKKKVFWLFPNDFDSTISSMNRGIPLVKCHPKTGIAKNIFEFSDKLINPLTQGNYRGIKGLFGKAV